MMNFVLDRLKKIVTKGKNAGQQPLLLLPQSKSYIFQGC